MDHQEIRHRDQQRHRREIPFRVVAELLEDVRIDRVRADVAHEEGLAVGGSSQQLLDTDLPAAAGAALDDDRLAERIAHLRADLPRQNVRKAARKRHDEAQRLRGKALRRERQRKAPHREQGEQRLHLNPC